MQAGRRVPTIDDLRVKLCYICREEERYDTPEDPPRAWTHPCNCTLIAHETCLLHWIQTSQTNRARANALKCPQCGVPYQLTSSNPWILRLLNMGNKGLSAVGRVVTVGSLTVVVVSLGTAMYLLCTGYGAYALRDFLGPEMFDLLLTDDPSNWPWHSFINLPLIPISLIFSRLPIKRHFTPLVPLLLAWPTSTPVLGHRFTLVDDGPTDGNQIRPLPPLPAIPQPQEKELFPILPNWPPPPIVLGLFVLPIVRDVYKRLFTQFSKWVLESTPGTGVWGGERLGGGGGGGGGGQGGRGERELRRVVMQDAVDEEPFLRIRVNAHVDEEEDGPAPPGGMPARANRAQRQGNGNDNGNGNGNNNNNDRERQNGNGGNNNNNANNANNINENNGGAEEGGRDGLAVEDTIHISGTSLGRLIGGALIIPRISSLMGSFLLYLSKYSSLLRRFLAVRPPVRWTTTPNARYGVGLGVSLLISPSLMGHSWEKLSLLRKLSVAGMLGLSVAWRGTYVWAECDPVWWRNSLGFGLFTVVKDCVQLLHLYLTKRELETRRVKNRSFEGVDVRELDLIEPQVHT